MVDLARQGPVSAHPLPMGLGVLGVGLTLFTVSLVNRSRFIGDPFSISGMDFLATEDLAPIVTEDTGEGLGLL